MTKNKHSKSGGSGYGYDYGSGYTKVYSKDQKELYLINHSYPPKQANNTTKYPSFMHFREARYDNKA